MPSTTSVCEDPAVTLYAVCPVRVIHSDAELWRLVARRSSRIVPMWKAPPDVDAAVLERVLNGLRRLSSSTERGDRA